MALPPQKFREIVFQILFSAEFVSSDDALTETALMLMKELKVTKRTVLEANQRVGQILAKQIEIDEKIRASSHEYQMERISSAEKCALRLGVFELFHDPALPQKVALAEAIRLTRKFGTAEGSQFVNAVLDAIYSASG